MSICVSAAPINIDICSFIFLYTEKRGDVTIEPYYKKTHNEEKLTYFTRDNNNSTFMIVAVVIVLWIMH